jgi:hypothetical protein
MSLSDTAELAKFTDTLARDTTGNEAAIRQQVIDAGRQTPSDTIAELADISSNVDKQFDSAEGTLSRQQRALGQTMSEGEKRVQQRRLGLGRALTNVDARNRGVSNIRTRIDQARSSAGNLRDILNDQELQNRTSLSGADVSRTASHEQAKAGAAAKKTQTLGTIAAIGLSFVPGGAFLAPAALAASQGIAAKQAQG